jgi:hypothetical protein
MTGTLLAALSSEEVVLSSPFGMVTTNFVIVKDTGAQSQIILSLNRLTDIQTIRTSYPGFLVISAGLFILAAASMCSTQGGGAGIPLGLLAIGFSVAFLATRRALLVFYTGSEITETVSGSLRGAAAFMRAVEAARRELEQ